jgi:ubiquitin C-terminal hydrolase
MENLESGQKKPLQLEYTRYESEDVPRPFGFNNTGAICWFNALTQFLLSIPSFNRRVLDNEGPINNFATKYYNFIKNLVPDDPDTPADLSSVSSASSELLIELVREILRRNRTTVLGMGQQCSNEGFTEFIDAMGMTTVEDLFANVYRNIIVCPNCNEVVSEVRDRTLYIGVPSSTIFTSEEDFRQWLCRHISVVDYTCPKCYHSTRVKRGEQLKMLREVLVITFDKFERRAGIWYPDSVTFASLQGGSLRYDLCAKIEWGGSANPATGSSSGHYWATCKRHGRWYTLNDTSVSNATSRPTDSTYMLAYHLV